MKKVLASIGTFFATEAVDIAKDFKVAGNTIGAFIKGEEPKIEPLIQAILTDIAKLKTQAVTDITTAAIAAAKLLLADLIAAL